MRSAPKHLNNTQPAAGCDPKLTVGCFVFAASPNPDSTLVIFRAQLIYEEGEFRVEDGGDEDLVA